MVGIRTQEMTRLILALIGVVDFLCRVFVASPDEISCADAFLLLVKAGWCFQEAMMVK